MIMIIDHTTVYILICQKKCGKYHFILLIKNDYDYGIM